MGHRWRDRDLGPVVTTPLFLRQVLEVNVAVGELRRCAGLSFTDSAYCQTRARLPRALLERLQQAVTQELEATTAARPSDRWCGHRVYLLDSLGFSMPDTAPVKRRQRAIVSYCTLSPFLSSPSPFLS